MSGCVGGCCCGWMWCWSRGGVRGCAVRVGLVLCCLLIAWGAGKGHVTPLSHTSVSWVFAGWDGREMAEA